MKNKYWRSNIYIVVIMIIDGYWNRGDLRVNVNMLKSMYGVDFIIVGVDGYSKWQFELLVILLDYVFEYVIFMKFREFVKYIWGGKVKI